MDASQAFRERYPSPSSTAASAVMRGNKRSGTRPELAVTSRLHAAGLRFRRDYALLPDGHRVRPDIVFTKQRIAVFIDGCYWHCCPLHGNKPEMNAGYWHGKLQRNVERDERNTFSLRAAGWTVLRYWEHEPAERVANEIAAHVRRDRRSSI